MPPQRAMTTDGPNWLEQDGLLREMWMHNQPPAAIAKALDRSVPAIMTRAARLGVPLTPQTATPPTGRSECAIDALSYIYKQFAEEILAFDGKLNPAPGFPSFGEGLRAVAFVDAVLRNTNAANKDKWTPIAV